MKRLQILWILSFFILSISPKQGYSEENNKDFTKPEEVIKRFIINRANTSFIDNNPDYCKDVVKFILNGDKYLYKDFGAGLDILGNFSISDVSIKGNTAKVKVKLNFCGVCSNDGSCEIGKEKEIVAYNLVNVDNTWKIVWEDDESSFLCGVWMSVPKATEFYEYILQHYDRYKYLGLKKKLIEDTKKMKKCAEESK